MSRTPARPRSNRELSTRRADPELYVQKRASILTVRDGSARRSDPSHQTASASCRIARAWALAQREGRRHCPYSRSTAQWHHSEH
jgi:hypothetical protein